MRHRRLAQAILAVACALTVCVPYKAALAEEQIGTGAIDVTVRQVAPRDSNNDDSSKRDITPQALEDAEDVASGNAWIVASVSDNKSDGIKSNPTQEAPETQLAKTGDNSLLGIAAVISCLGTGIGIVALLLRARDSRRERSSIRGGSDE